jgi:hypothetical protein
MYSLRVRVLTMIGVISGAGALATGCSDSTPARSVKPPELVETRLLSTSAALAEWAKLNADQRRQLRARDASPPGTIKPPTIAIALQRLPGDADAIIVREPTLSQPDLLVFSDDAVDPRLLGAAAAMYYQFAQNNPGADKAQRQMLRLRPPSSSPGDAATRRARQLSSSHVFTRQIERAALGTSEATIPGIGRVRIIDMGR